MSLQAARELRGSKDRLPLARRLDAGECKSRCLNSHTMSPGSGNPGRAEAPAPSSHMRFARAARSAAQNHRRRPLG